MEKIMTISLKHLLRRSMPKLKFMHFNVDKQQPTHLFRFKPGFKKYNINIQMNAIFILINTYILLDILFYIIAWDGLLNHKTFASN